MSKKEPTKSDNTRQETYWEFVERTADEVKTWPAWKVGGTSNREPQRETPVTKTPAKDRE